MPSVRVLHCADVHIGAAESFLGLRAASRRAEALITFENIIKKAADMQIDIVLIAGDLFDSNKIEASVAESVLSCIRSVPNIKVMYSAGNHDPLNQDSPFSAEALPENLYVFDKSGGFFTFEDLKVRVYGMSFGEVYCQNAVLFEKYPISDEYINLMCIHGDLRADGVSLYNPITPKFIENSGMDYIALGHVHQNSGILRLGKTHFAYSGCPEGQGFDESGEKGVYAGEISKGECKMSFVPTAKRTHIRETIDISDCGKAGDISDKILKILEQKYGSNFGENLYRITLTGDLAEGFSVPTAEIIARLEGCVYFAKIKDRTSIKTDYSVLAKEKSLKGIFVKNMLSRINSAAPEEKQTFQSALTVGLKAFDSEVNFDEN